MVVVDFVPEVVRSVLDDGEGGDEDGVVGGVAYDVVIAGYWSAEDFGWITSSCVDFDGGAVAVCFDCVWGYG